MVQFMRDELGSAPKAFGHGTQTIARGLGSEHEKRLATKPVKHSVSPTETAIGGPIGALTELIVDSYAKTAGYTASALKEKRGGLADT